MVRRPVCARFRNPVLCRGIETSAKLDYDRQGIGVAGKVDEVAKLINVHVHGPTTLEVTLRLQAHERGGCLVFEAEGRPKFGLEFRPGRIARASPLGFCAQSAVCEGSSAPACEVGQCPVYLGLFVGEVVDGEGDIESAGGEE